MNIDDAMDSDSKITEHGLDYTDDGVDYTDDEMWLGSIFGANHLRTSNDYVYSVDHLMEGKNESEDYANDAKHSNELIHLSKETHDSYNGFDVDFDENKTQTKENNDPEAVHDDELGSADNIAMQGNDKLYMNKYKFQTYQL